MEAPDFGEFQYFPVNGVGMGALLRTPATTIVTRQTNPRRFPAKRTTEAVQRTGNLMADAALKDGPMALGATGEGPAQDWQRCNDGIGEMEDLEKLTSPSLFAYSREPILT
ncbi:disease resistance protein [Striga asiatica]|uniref:Disease resistance protein n=1 Tax=Striga asiatica TaxID=4170 RepID=A0A5A7R5K3_STRAF|nr:disease resistance protein [Striga asiatica]